MSSLGIRLRCDHEGDSPGRRYIVGDLDCSEPDRAEGTSQIKLSIALVAFLIAACSSEGSAPDDPGGTTGGGSNSGHGGTGDSVSAGGGGTHGAAGVGGVGGSPSSGGSAGAAGIDAGAGGQAGEPDPIAGSGGSGGASAGTGSADASIANGANSDPVPCGDSDCNDENDCTRDHCDDGVCRNEPWSSSGVACEDELGWGTCIPNEPVCDWQCGEAGQACCSEFKCRGGQQCDMTETVCR